MARSDNSILFIGLGVAALAFLTYQATTSEDGTMNTLLTGARGIRNNNPGNIRRNATAWQGLSATQTDDSFFQFESMAYGIRAIGKILLTYAGRGVNTVDDIIATWAPSTENDTTAYVNAVATDVGVSPGDALDMRDPGTMFAVVRAIIKHENGAVPAMLISDNTVRDGVALALNS